MPAKGGAFGAALAALLAGALALPALAAKDDLDLVSRATGGAAGDADSLTPVISADGRHVTFYGGADNLSGDDDSAFSNVFVRDMVSGTTTLVSRATGAAGAGGTANSSDPVISGDGRLVAFDSAADNLDPDAADDPRNVFVRDVVSGTTTLVSRASTSAGGAPGDDSSSSAAIADGGRDVAFFSRAANLVAGDANGVGDVFVRDLVSGTTTLVSRASTATGAPGDASSFVPSISADGRQVAFVSAADNLVLEDDKAVSDVFVRDLLANTTTLVSRASGPAGAPGDRDSDSNLAISADGRHVAFRSSADNLSAEDAVAVSDVFVRDLLAGTTTLVSRATGAAGAGGDGDSSVPSISADGRYVAFASDADNLSAGDRKDVTNLFVRDLVAATTTLVTRAAGPAGAGADGTSFFPSISADGSFVAFQSAAGNLSAEDVDPVVDVFRREVLGTPRAAAAAPTPGPPPPADRRARCAGRQATIVGTARRDVIRGTRRRDVIAALAGNDLVRGLGGNDLICLGAGADRALGGPGADRILGGPGRDVLLGGPGRDRLLGQAGRDRALGGAGRDICPAEVRAGC